MEPGVSDCHRLCSTPWHPCNGGQEKEGEVMAEMAKEEARTRSLERQSCEIEGFGQMAEMEEVQEGICALFEARKSGEEEYEEYGNDSDADDENKEGDKYWRQEIVKVQQLETRSVNITSLLGCLEILAEMQGHLIFLQETAATKAMAKNAAK